MNRANKCSALLFDFPRDPSSRHFQILWTLWTAVLK